MKFHIEFDVIHENKQIEGAFAFALLYFQANL